MTSVGFLVIIASLVAFLVAGTEDTGSVHVTFAHKGINVQTDTTQDQGCEPAGGMSGITNACTATSTSGGSTVTLSFEACGTFESSFYCPVPAPPNNCNNIGCTNITCATTNPSVGGFNCVTDNNVQLTSCTAVEASGIFTFTRTRTVPGTGGITQSGGVTGG